MLQTNLNQHRPHTADGKEVPCSVQDHFMNETKNVAFRSSMSGYNRKDVNQYILTINREMEEKDELLKNAHLEMEENAKTFETERTSLEASISFLKSEKEALESVLAATQESAGQLKEEIASLREKLLSAEMTADTLRTELLQRSLPNGTDDKLEKYDRISAQIGDIMISANTSADAIVAAANEHATRIVSETEKEADYIRTRLSKAADEMLSQISSELHTSTDSCLCELMTALREMRDNTAAMINDFEKRSKELSVKVEYYQSTLSESVNETLKSMDEKYGIRRTK